MKRSTKSAFIGCLLLGLTACADSTNSPDATVSADNGSMTFALPRVLQDSRAIDRNQLSVSATLNGTTRELTPNANRTSWTGSLVVPENQTSTLSIEWMHGDLPVAGYNESIGPINGDTTITLSSINYESTGDNYDFDRDSYSNLREIKDGFDPKDAQSPGAPDLDVVIRWIAPSDAPTIDGLYDNIWNSAKFQDIDGNDLRIDNLMIDLGADRPDGTAEYRWFTMHDGTYLYIMVLAENVATQTLQGESTNMWRDDTLNLFIDGDNSKSDNYDDVNDYHMFIPFLKLLEPSDSALASNYTPSLQSNGDLILNDANQIYIQNDLAGGMLEFVDSADYQANRSSDGRFEPGPNSTPWPTDPEAFVFANCRCSEGQHTYEIRLRMADFGIEEDQAFGVELQIDDDIDGGDRDARYGWKHPSRANGVNTDNTYTTPSFMGTAILQ